MRIMPIAERALRHALNVSGLESRWVKTKLARHHLYDFHGTGHLPTVVLLHGIASDGLSFALLMHALKPHVRRLLLPEAPGHGFSSNPVRALTPETLFESMAEVLDREIDEPAILFGNSLGGAFALNYAIAQRNRVAGLFLVSPGGASMDEADLRQFMDSFRIGTRADALAFLIRLHHRTPWFFPLLAGEVQRRFSQDAVRSFTSAVRPVHLLSSEQLGRLSMPIHLVWGRSEKLFPREHLVFFKHALPPHAVIEEPEGMGHCAHLDAPTAIAAKLKVFAERVALRSRRSAQAS